MTKKPGVKFDRPELGVLSSGGSLRYSTYLRALRKNGAEDIAARLEAEKGNFGSHCPTHGFLEDPILGVTGEGDDRRAVFGCPFCSSPEVLALWRKEGMRS